VIHRSFTQKFVVNLLSNTVLRCLPWNQARHQPGECDLIVAGSILWQSVRIKVDRSFMPFTLRLEKLVICSLFAVVPWNVGLALTGPESVAFSQSATTVDAYELVEIVATVAKPDVSSCFTDAFLSGTFQTSDGKKQWPVEGFCDSDNGGTLRIRFMPSSPGDYKYTVVYRQGQLEKRTSGTFRTTDGHRRGPIRIDPQFRWHFIWEGTGEHYFFNGTTAFWLMGWSDDRVINASIERLHRLKVNRIRVTIAGRTNTFYGEPVMVSEKFTVSLSPWPAENAEDFLHPGFDYSRFNVKFWRRFDDMLRFARERDMVISVVLDMNDARIHPVAGSEDERRFIHYAVNRFAAFSNITWDLGDDLDGYRDDQWTHDTGTLLKKWDPYHHLATSHPMGPKADGNLHQDRTSDWFDFTSFQEWSRDQHNLMLRQRKLQEQTGRIIPQTNEEYGYEDHLPMWSLPASESADTLRKTAWEIVMAGGYQTAGESARRGTNIWPDTGGGWINGRGDDTMTMFLGYGHMVDFFTNFAWWKTEPHDELVDGGNYCLAKPGEIYAVYLLGDQVELHAQTHKVTVRLESGSYKAVWFNALSGERIPLPPARGPAWTSPETPDQHDWALLLQRE
jgi:hypothetical protein